MRTEGGKRLKKNLSRKSKMKNKMINKMKEKSLKTKKILISNVLKLDYKHENQRKYSNKSIMHHGKKNNNSKTYNLI